ncbi:MAG: hypothetical protein V4511_01075 [Bacteroidota bacterium]
MIQYKKAYDIDIADLYFSLKRYIEKNEIPNSEEALEGFWWSIYYYCEANDINFKKEFQLGKIIIVQPNNLSNYPHFLARQLAYIDIAKINLFLNYQKTIFNLEIFKVNSFATLVEHTVYRQITWMSLYRTDDRLEKITKWIEDDQKLMNSVDEAKKMNTEFVDHDYDKRGVLAITNLQIENSIISKKKAAAKKNVEIAPSFTLIEFENDIDYFVKKAQGVMEVFLGLKKGGFICEDSKLDNFKDIFSGKKIRPENKINWKGSFIELQMMILILMRDLKKIKKIKPKWETAIKSFIKDGNDMKITQLSGSNSKKTNEGKLREILKNF